VKLSYFAWVRERIGKSEEDIELPAHVTTIKDVLVWLKGRGEEYEHAFEHPDVVRAAIDRRHARPETSIAGASEIAFFPPMTGG